MTAESASETDLLPMITAALDTESWLTPIPAPLRARYTALLQAQRRPHNRRLVLIQAIMFDLFVITEVKTAPDILYFSGVLRFFVFTPCVFLFLALDLRGRLGKFYGPWVALLGALPTVLSAILVMNASPDDTQGLPAVGSIPLILLATGLIQRLTPGEVLVNTVISVISFIVAALTVTSVPQAEVSTWLFIDVSVGFCAVIFNWQLETRDRRLFLLQTSEAITRAALADHNRGLLAQTQTDGLTGVANRRFFDDSLTSLWRESCARRAPLSLILMDVDHFKLFNDHYGHQGGDDCLRLVATTGRREIRTGDLFARYGGEEFAVLLPDSPLATAIDIAERMRTAISDLGVPHDGVGQGAHVTVSLGAACVTPTEGDDPRALIEQADSHLYAAKRAGRNRVATSPEAAGISLIPPPGAARPAVTAAASRPTERGGENQNGLRAS